MFDTRNAAYDVVRSPQFQKMLKTPTGRTPTGEPYFRAQSLPGYTEAKTELAAQIDQQLDQLRRALLSQGYASDVVERVIARTRTQMTGMSQLLGQEALAKTKISEARRSERTNFLQGVAGMALGRLIPSPEPKWMKTLQEALSSVVKL